jgi:hypothetical protein
MKRVPGRISVHIGFQKSPPKCRKSASAEVIPELYGGAERGSSSSPRSQEGKQNRDIDEGRCAGCGQYHHKSPQELPRGEFERVRASALALDAVRHMDLVIIFDGLEWQVPFAR